MSDVTPDLHSELLILAQEIDLFLLRKDII
jgi:hypothetical protein